jgi:hypothetical protein
MSIFLHVDLQYHAVRSLMIPFPSFSINSTELQEIGVTASRCHFPGARSDVTCRVCPTLSPRPEAYRIIVESTG